MGKGSSRKGSPFQMAKIAEKRMASSRHQRRAEAALARKRGSSAETDEAPQRPGVEEDHPKSKAE